MCVVEVAAVVVRAVTIRGTPLSVSKFQLRFQVQVRVNGARARALARAAVCSIGITAFLCLNSVEYGNEYKTHVSRNGLDFCLTDFKGIVHKSCFYRSKGVWGIYRPLRPKSAISHPITIQNMRFER